MSTYIARRVLQTVVIMFGLTIFFFLILHAEPGGPCQYLLGVPNPNTESLYQHCIVAHGLNKSLPEQYLSWLVLVAHGDFGQNIFGGGAVLDSMKARLPATILLIGISYIVAEAIALSLGLLGALKRYSFYDQFLTFFAYIGLALPTFWLALMLILLFAVKWPLFPPGGIVSAVSQNPIVSNIPPFGTGPYWSYLLQHPAETIGDFLWHLVLPGATLAIITIGGDSRFMRASMLDVINQDFVRTARAKGLPQSKVVFKHALRNALLPIITNVGLFIPALVSGAVITETIFAWPGMGQYFINALGHKDPNALQAFLLLAALFVLIGNLAADLMYAWADPRIRYS